ncbi:MAG: hypothetical protein CMK78_13435 [Pseudomonadales bacterium]|nr:hypothetical protein [Pseudomonadales bacterium]|tara:strand:+ start:9898 stop:10437 length:540 start_codon:yes stop_codon:yes gene_type:complete
MIWSGQTVCCIASGPSLAANDCALIEQEGLPTIAVNSSWQMARFADVIYAADPAWWDHNQHLIDVPTERWSSYQSADTKYGINRHRVPNQPHNSGMRAIQFAIERGAARVLLLGYDCSVKGGTHWHGDHKSTRNPDAKRCAMWLQQFAMIDRKQTEIINCSRETALACFPRMTLEQALC